MLFRSINAMTSTGRSFDIGPTFTPWVGFGVMCAYAAAALLVGGWLMVRRDA